jgi:amino acid adenylation domain-containing protein
MSVQEWLSDLRGAGVELWAEGESLGVRAPKDVLVPSLRDELRRRKPEILRVLRGVSGSIPRLPDAPSYELSHAQRRLWVLSQFDPDSTAYNIPAAVLLEGALDADALRGALQAVVARHESLRTSFFSVDGHPRQRIEDAPALEVPCISLDESDLQRHATELARQPFDLERAPLLHAEIVRLGALRSALILVIHHLVADGWSLSVLVRELSELYSDLRRGLDSSLLPLPIQYRDFAAWQHEQLRGDAGAEHEAYWLARITAPVPALELPTDFPRPPVRAFDGQQLSFTIPPAQRDALLQLARAQRATLFIVLASVVKALLYRYTNQEDIYLGTPVAGRTHPDLDGQVGFYLNNLVLRDAVDARMPFTDLLRSVRDTALEAFEHQMHPFDKLVDDCDRERDLSHAPLFDVFVVLQNAGSLALSLDGIRATALPVDSGTSKYDLSFDFVDGADGLLAGIRYRTDLFLRDRIERMRDHFVTLVVAILRDPRTEIGALELLPPHEQDRLLRTFNDTAAPEPDMTVVELFRGQARRVPDRIAATYEDRHLTYRELDAMSDAVAARLETPGVLVAVQMERSLEMLAVLLGILKAGCAYVPVDPAYPRMRIEHMLRDSNPAVILTGIESASSSTSPVPVRPDSLAYLLYTSGSTGTPKGVEIPHRALTNLLLSMRERPGLGEHDSLLAVTTISFDIAALELYLPLITGARVVIATAAQASDGLALAARLQRGDITVMQATPGTWRMLLAAGWEGTKNLKILCGGEALPRDLADALLARCGSLWNMYGPTETTIWSSMHETGPDEQAVVTIGRPIRNTRMYVLDDRRRLVPIGVPGQLWIAGSGVANGYRNRPDLTAERFVDDPFVDNSSAAGRMYRTGDLARFHADGTLEFIGRADHQVKVRGYRVETGEIESALLEHASLRDAVVTIRADDRGEAGLIAYVVPHDAAPEAAELREHLARSLPAYMIPSTFIALDALPLASTGKIDRAALPPPDPFLQADAAVEPRDELEARLARIWSDVLDRDAIGVFERFFDAGGHSLKATRALFRMHKELALDVTLIDMFRNPTVAGFAAMLRARGQESHA